MILKLYLGLRYARAALTHPALTSVRGAASVSGAVMVEVSYYLSCMQLEIAKKGYYMPAEEITLLPCPFCGSEAKLDDTEGGDSIVHCMKCEAYFLDDMLWNGNDYDSKSNAAAKWNRRAYIKE